MLHNAVNIPWRLADDVKGILSESCSYFFQIPNCREYRRNLTDNIVTEMS